MGQVAVMEMESPPVWRSPFPESRRLPTKGGPLLIFLGVVGLIVTVIMVFDTVPSAPTDRYTCGTMWTPVGAGLSCVARRHAHTAMTLVTLACSGTVLVAGMILSWWGGER